MDQPPTTYLQTDPNRAGAGHLEARARQQTAVAELGQRALAGLDVPTLMAEAAAQTASALGVEYCKVLELLPGSDDLFLRAGVGWREALVGRTTVGAGQGSQAGYTLLSGEPVIVTDLRAETRFNGSLLLVEHGVVSGISVTIHGYELPFGVLGAHTARRQTFTQDDVHFLQAVANVLGAAIERKRAEAALRESQAQTAAIIASAMDAIITVDAGQRITIFNAAAERMFRCTAAEALGQPLDRLLPERFRLAHRRHIQHFGQANVTRRSMGALGAISGLRADGEEFPIEASISQSEAGGQKRFTVILRDVTLRQRAEKRLCEQAALLDHAQDAIAVRDLNDCVLFWNRSAERLYGWSAAEAVGQDVRKLVYQGQTPQFEQAKQTVVEQGEWVGELRQVTKNGKELIAECHWTLVRDEQGQPASIFAINTDITAKKKLEAQFLRAQRMESIGTLAGGIAHDLNNVLSPIVTAIQLLQLRFTDEESRRLLHILCANAERGGEMVKQVLSFARGIEGERIALQPNHLIKEIIKILKETLPKSIEIQFHLPADLWMVRGDATQLHQVLINLCINARDAMPGGGRLKIAAENESLDETYTQMSLDVKPGRYVVITVADTGVGIPPGHLDRIFDPFFTTKDIGKGTGLGLTTVLGIVKGHGGFINVYSEVGKGAQFKIHLPALDTGVLRQADDAHPELPAGHGELILVVDDEAAVREIAVATLEAFGYRALRAGDGAEALALYAQHKNEIKVVLTDMMMPYLDGPATIRALRRFDPGVRIIASSGLAEHGKTAEAAQAGVKTFLPKPYTADQLLKAVAEALGRR